MLGNQQAYFFRQTAFYSSENNAWKQTEFETMILNLKMDFSVSGTAQHNTSTGV